MHYDLIKQGHRLTNASKLRPRQVDLRRAISAAYYACFHALAKSTADILAGSSSSQVSRGTWVQVYRSLDHGFVKKACQQTAAAGFPNSIVDFAMAFSALQEERHLSDYDPDVRYLRSDVRLKIDLADRAIKGLLSSTTVDRRAFAIHVTLKKR